MKHALIIDFGEYAELERAAGEHRSTVLADRWVGDDRLLKVRIPADAPDDLYDRLVEAYDLRPTLPSEVVDYFDAIW